MEIMTTQKQETDQPQSAVHMGQNIRIARTIRGLSQEALGLDINMRQNQVSELEKQAIIEDDALIHNIARALNCEVKFIKEFVVENAMRTYNIHDNEFTNQSAENSHDIQGHSIGGNGIDIETQNNYTYPIDDIKTLYEKLLEEKDKQINRFEKEVEELKARMQEIEKGKR